MDTAVAGLRMFVCVPAGVADVRAAVRAAMAPFELDAVGDHGHDRRIWDRATVDGGSNECGFRVVSGAETDPRLIHDEPLNGPRPSLPGWCAGGPRGLLDLEWPRLETEREAGAAWDTWQRLLATYPPARPLADFFAERHSHREGYSTQGAVNEHRAQPLIQAMAQAMVSAPNLNVWSKFASVLVVDGSEDALERNLSGIDGAIAFEVPRHEFVAGASSRAGHRGGMLTLDGWWCEPGQRPVHAYCPDRDSCDHLADAIDHSTDVDGCLAALDAEVYVVSVHCHV